MRIAVAPEVPAVPGAWRRFQWPLLLGAGVLLVAVLGVLTEAGGNARTLDPDGVSARGSRALATLLRDRGVAVERVATVDAAVATSGLSGPTTIFVPFPTQFPAGEIRRLAVGSTQLVLLAPDRTTLAAVAPEITPARSGPVRSRRPACDAAAALLAGSVELGGSTYSVAAALGRTLGCYPAGGGVSLVIGAGAGQVNVIGTERPFTNEALGNDGNAALALSLLGTSRRVVWLLARPAETASGTNGQRGLLDLLPDRLLLALLQAAVAVLLFALWRGRRLGGVIAEELPVLVRGTETTEGRARLYRASSARGAAATALRTGTQRRLATRVGLPPDPTPEALVDAVGTRTGRSAATLRELLYGPEPSDPAALVRLANDLDNLAAEVQQP
ncbi:MAG: DUF4350 domain-containing protein [Frankiaceae bacterium]